MYRCGKLTSFFIWIYSYALSYPPVTGDGGPYGCKTSRLTFSRRSALRWRWGCWPHAPAAFNPQEDLLFLRWKALVLYELVLTLLLAVILYELVLTLLLAAILYELVLTLLLTARPWSHHQLLFTHFPSLQTTSNYFIPLWVISPKIRSYKPLFHVSLHKEHVAFRDKESDKPKCIRQSSET
jgi:hypothetical protein